MIKQKPQMIAVFLGLIFFLYIVFNYTNTKGSKSSPLTANTNALYEKAKSALPVRLKIPRINTNATIEYVGLLPDGSVGVPKGPSGVAWFNLGPRPGEVGNSIIDGHSGYKNGREAVFDNLYKLKKGDKIYVEDEKGVTTTFIVREFYSYAKNEDASKVFISNDGKMHLNLITCTGDWNVQEKTHSKRLVVFTDKE